jgi:hypothetical protein
MLNLVGHKELGFFMAMGVNSQHQELVPNVMKNPSFSLPIFYLFFDLASLLQEE